MNKNLPDIRHKTSKEIGNIGETIAAEYLVKKGFEILQRNYYSQYGEIDIIAKINEEIIFFEVKTRTNLKFGNPEDSINQKKIECIVSTGLCFLEEYSDDEVNWHIDLLAIKLSKDVLLEIEHFKDIND